MEQLSDFEIHESWLQVLHPLSVSPHFQKLRDQLRLEYRRGPVFPPRNDVFRCFQKTAFDQVKVVILGQDPYHGIGQAHGLSFSVPLGVKVPPSLRNIQKELKIDHWNSQELGCLDTWAEQGVLLLNTVMTVRAGAAGSHRGIGWEAFTDGVLKAISQKLTHVVFFLWGKDAQSKVGLIDQNKHLVLQAPHPSPLSAYRGFFGCNHFDQANQYLDAHGMHQIDWHSPWAKPFDLTS